ncbi:MAG: hypothetical protein PSX42_22985 [bacterium]|nr:hypothetical protein [bacterium]
MRFVRTSLFGTQEQRIHPFITYVCVENVDTTVRDFLDTTNQDIKHLIAQKDIPFSNSKIEAFNKIIKHQFLLPQNLTNRKQLETASVADLLTYNRIRPQLSLQGYTSRNFFRKTHSFKSYKPHFSEHKILRISTNQQNRCNGCN